VLSRAQKVEQVAELKEKFGRATCVYIADFRGVPVDSVNQLRRRVRREGGGNYEYRVTKNRMLKLAADGGGVAKIAAQFRGPTAVAISYGDPVGLAKILCDFAKDNQSFSLKGGVLEGTPIAADDIAKLATLPSIDQLRARIAGVLLAPAAKLARLLLEPGAQLARIAGARAKQGEADAQQA
jgi:large subunit ribosomal protein L10